MDRFLIGPMDIGLQTDLKPFQLPDQAFSSLNNAYVFRGRVRKRFGSSYMGADQFSSRFRIAVGTTNAITGNLSGTVPGNVFAIGQAFSIDNAMYTVVTAGDDIAMLQTVATTTATYSTVDGDFVFVGAPLNAIVYFYPAQPVMGLTLYEIGPVNDHPSYGFDTQFAYKFTGSWQRSESTGNPVWHGSNSDFFWATNWQGNTANLTSLFVSNFHVTNYNAAVVTVGPTQDDPMWTYDGTTWSIFTPKFLIAGVGNFVKTARIILAFRNRLVLLNTVEVSEDGTTNSNFVNRCRFSANSSPFLGGLPFCQTAWLNQNQVGSKQAGFIDATTEEAIISAEFIKDRLMVYFERSTWELAYTGNEIQPFNWYKINTELGSESTFSIVQFDKFVIGIGQTGIHSCNGSNVSRIDNAIPDQIFQITNAKNGFKRVAGIRDYFVEMIYWAFPNSAQEADDYPNKVLVYNYKNQTWAINDDTITAFGYFEQQLDTTWASAKFTWVETNNTWTSGVLQSEFRQVIAGNQEGYVFLILPDRSSNAAVLQITNMTYDSIEQTLILTIINHNLEVSIPEFPSYIALNGAIGVTYTGPGIYEVVSIDDQDTVRVLLTGDPPTFIPSFTGTYQGGGTAALVSCINFMTKQWNFYGEQGKNAAIAKIDFNVDKTTAGQITVDYFPSFTQLSMIQQGNDTGAIMGTNVLQTSPYDPILVPLEQIQDQLWHPIYLQTVGETIQLHFYMSNEQLTEPDIAFAEFQLNALIIYAQPAGRLQ